MNHKLCILAAGKGSRNDSIVGLHKALLPIENKPVISKIIEKVSEDTEIIIALGYKADQIKSYLKAIHPKRKFNFVEVDNYDQVGSGPGYSLLCCKGFLNCPFVFTSVDTILGNDDVIENFNNNWVGVSKIDENYENYCLVDSDNNKFKKFYYGKGSTAFIGIAGIYDYKKFWKSLESAQLIKNEIQVISGFDKLKEIELKYFNWYDTGNNKSYELTRKKFPNEVVANKTNEALFIENGKVIKYFDNAAKTKMRYQRSVILGELTPKVDLINENMYCYDYIEGELLSNFKDYRVFKNFLEFYKSNFLQKHIENDKKFINNCYKMYESKTIQRIKKFKHENLDKISLINGVKVNSINSMIETISWDRLFEDAKQSHFHGDMQPENIIFSNNENKFYTIDWRESFGDSIEIGDAYYDLGKIYHALLINGSYIMKGLYSVQISENEASIEYAVRSNLLQNLQILEEFCKENKLSWQQVKLVGILNYLNIACLYENFHKGEYGRFLFLLGKLLLAEVLSENK
jgi:GTP:adenosylcobinamide-phosphate guanylyltransferase